MGHKGGAETNKLDWYLEKTWLFYQVITQWNLLSLDQEMYVPSLNNKISKAFVSTVAGCVITGHIF